MKKRHSWEVSSFSKTKSSLPHLKLKLHTFSFIIPCNQFKTMFMNNLIEDEEFDDDEFSRFIGLDNGDSGSSLNRILSTYIMGC